MANADKSQPIVLFDGICVLCNGAVNFITPRMQPNRLRFISLQSQQGKAILTECDLATDELDTFVLYENGLCFVRSDAALRLTKYLKRPWGALQIFKVVPKFIRDNVYNWIAKNRYKWFGRLK